MQSPTLPPQPQPQEETRDMQSPTLRPQPPQSPQPQPLLQEETREMQSPTLPPQPQPPQPTPASPTPSWSQPSSASSPLPPPNPSPPSLPPSPDPKLPSGQEISSASPSPPHRFSSTAPGFSSPHSFSSSAPPSSSSLLSGGMPAHHPSPPPPKPASSKILAIWRKMKIDVICAIMNILAQAASVVLDLLAKRFVPLSGFLGFIFALLAIVFAIGELWWMRKRKVRIGPLEYAESVMAIIQLVSSALAFLLWSSDTFPFVEYSGSLFLALLIGYYKVAKMVGRWHPSETDGNSLIVIRVDSLKTAPCEVGKWIYDNRIQDVKWESADSLARLFGAQQG